MARVLRPVALPWLWLRPLNLCRCPQCLLLSWLPLLLSWLSQSKMTDSPESAQVCADSTTGWRGVSWTSWSYAAACLCQCWRQNSPIIVEIFTRWNIFVYSRSMSILSSSESNRAMPTQWTSPQHFLHLHSYPVRLKRLVPASCFSVLITTVLLPPCLLLAELSQSSLYGSDTHTG